MQQYNSAQNNLTFNDSVGDNIDNGLNNSIRGAKNIIHEGNSNRISGMANQVNGSNNVIGGIYCHIQVITPKCTAVEI